MWRHLNLRWIVGAALLLLIATAGGAVSAAQNQVKNPDTIIEATIGGPETLDPAWGYDTASGEVIQNVYDTLIFPKADSASEFVPMLSTNVPNVADGTISKDGLTYTFHIRQGVKFQNGDDLTPFTVKYSFERDLIQDRAGGPIWILLDPILNVGTWDSFVAGVAKKMGVADQYAKDLKTFDATKPNTYTATMKQVDQKAFNEMAGHFEIKGNDFIVHLAKPAAYFLSTLVGNWGSIVDWTWVTSKGVGGWNGGAATWRFFHNPKAEQSKLFSEMNGTGPYKLASWDRVNKKVILVRNDHYWRTPAAVKTAIIEGIDEFSTRFLLFQKGDADMIYVPRQNVSQVDPLVAELCTPKAGGPDFTMPANRDKCQATGNKNATLRLFKDLGENINQGVYFQYNINPTSKYIGSGKMDGQGVPPDFFSDINVRKGFAYAFQYKTYIQQAWLGEAVQPTGPIPASLPFNNPENPIYSYNLNDAKAEFQMAWGGAGHIVAGPNGVLDSTQVLTDDDVIKGDTIQPGPDGILETSALGDDQIVVDKTGELWNKGFNLTLLYNTGNAQRKTATQIFQKNVQGLNSKFSITIQSEAWPQYLKDLIAGNLTMFVIGWLEDFHDPHDWVVPLMASYGAFSGFQGKTLLDYAKAHWDALINAASIELNKTKRQADYNKLQLWYFEQAPSVVTVQALGRHYEQLWVEGWFYNPLYPGQYFYNMSK